MQIEKMDALLSSADELFKAAESEAMRSEEDVVTHLICNHSRQCIINYLHGFLLKNDVDPTPPLTMASLLEQCKDLDARFELADITPIDCRFETHDRDYCLEKNKVDGCFKSAIQVRNIVKSETPGF